MAEPRTHDYRRRYWGHDYTWRPDPDSKGHTGSAIGWGAGISEGDFLILAGPDGGGSPYRVVSIRYFSDPKDMWEAKLEYDLTAPAPT